MTWLRNPRVFLAPGLVLILVAIGGRFTLDRAGFLDLAWVDLRECGLGDDPAAVLKERNVVVSSGLQFGPQGAGHVRLNFATSPAILAETVKAMAG